MPVIDTNTTEQAATLPAPPSAGLAALIGSDNKTDAIKNSGIPYDSAAPAHVPPGEEMGEVKPPKAPKPKNPILLALEEKAKAAAAAKKAAEEEAKKIAAEKKAAAAALQSDKEAARIAKQQQAEQAKAEKEAEKARKAAEKEQAKAAAQAKREAAKNALPDVSQAPQVEVKGLNDSQLKTIMEGKASAALKIAWTSELNGEFAYKKLAERFGYSIKPLVQALVEEKSWPVQDDGTPWGYQKVYKAEKENGLKSFGHMVNRSAERFSALNPANIAAREKARAEALAKQKEQAALEAAGLASKAATKTTTIKSSEVDYSALTAEELLKTAKACILAMDKNALAILEADQEVKDAFGWLD